MKRRLPTRHIFAFHVQSATRLVHKVLIQVLL
jgi:hypothetical protein